MNKTIFTLFILFLLSFSFTTHAAPLAIVEKGLNMIPSGSILDTLIPSRKNCNYVSDKQYEPFSDINANFPGAKTLTGGKPFIDKSKKNSSIDCVNVAGGTENLLKLLFTTAITIIIVLTVISISVAGIQFMTEQATGQIKGGAKKRLQNSFIALGLGLLSYTILYTVNKQLVNFTFNPVSIDIHGAIGDGINDANIAALSSGASTALVDAARPVVPTNGVGLSNPSPTGYVNKLTGAPCTPFVGPPAPGAAPDPCVKQDTLAGAYAGWGTNGVGATTGVGGTANSAEAQKINNAAQAMLGQTTCNVNYTNNGKLACAYVVNNIINNGLGKPLTGQTDNTDTFGRSTSDMKAELDASSRFYLVGTSIGAVQPGDIVISPTVGVNVGHVGIYTTSGKIISNSSSKTEVDDHFTPTSWSNYYTNQKGLQTYIYRPGS